jgi:hypothetical protein
MAHGKGYVMVRRPAGIPFVLPERYWTNLPFVG